jgi:hypothetical protein
MNENPIIVLAVISFVIICITGAYIMYHDTSIDARLMAERTSCEDLEYNIERQHKKITENIFTSVLEEVYEEKCK